VDSTDRKRFAYITHYSRIGLLFCHMFSKSKNDDVVSALSRALVESKAAATELTSGLDGQMGGSGGAISVSDTVEKTTGATVGIFELLLMGSVALKGSLFKIKTVSVISTQCIRSHRAIASLTIVRSIIARRPFANTHTHTHTHTHIHTHTYTHTYTHTHIHIHTHTHTHTHTHVLLISSTHHRRTIEPDEHLVKLVGVLQADHKDLTCAHRSQSATSQSINYNEQMLSQCLKTSTSHCHFQKDIGVYK
jgi:hypothetical protein